MAFGFGNFMQTAGAGMDKIHGLPMNQKLMMASQLLHGGGGPMDMLAAATRMGQPQQGAAPMMTAPSTPAEPSAPQAQGNQMSGLFQGLIPLLMQQNGGGMGSMAGGILGSLGGSGGALGSLRGKFGFGK